MELTTITGPMFSGKTTELIRLMRIYMIADKKVLLVKHNKDNRSVYIETHDGVTYPSISISNIEQLRDIIDHYEIIGIDEGQMYNNLYNFVQSVIHKNITFIIAGLTISFNHKILFDDMAKTCSIANKCIRLLSICNDCKSFNAVYSYNKFISKESDNVTNQIGGKDTYLALCRSCYFSK